MPLTAVLHESAARPRRREKLQRDSRPRAAPFRGIRHHDRHHEQKCKLGLRRPRCDKHRKEAKYRRQHRNERDERERGDAQARGARGLQRDEQQGQCKQFRGDGLVLDPGALVVGEAKGRQRVQDESRRWRQERQRGSGTAGRTSSPYMRTATKVAIASIPTRTPRCCVSTAARVRRTWRSTSSPAKRNSATMPSVEMEMECLVAVEQAKPHRTNGTEGEARHSRRHAPPLQHPRENKQQKEHHHIAQLRFEELVNGCHGGGVYAEYLGTDGQCPVFAGILHQPP